MTVIENPPPKEDSRCLMTIQREDGTIENQIAHGDYWDRLAGEFEKRNPGSKVIEMQSAPEKNDRTI